MVTGIKRVTSLFSFMEAVTSFATGASLTLATVIVTVDVLLSSVPSLALKVKVSVPLKFAVGV